MADALTAREANVTVLTVYQQKMLASSLKLDIVKWNLKEKFCFVATSNSILENLCKQMPMEYHPWLLEQPLVVVSTRMAERAKEFSFKHIFVAKSAHPDDILCTLSDIANYR